MKQKFLLLLSAILFVLLTAPAAFGNASVLVTWTDNNTTPNETGTEVQWRQPAGTWNPVTTTAPDVVSTVHGSLALNTTFCYQTRAKGDGATTSDGPWSTEVCVTTPATVTLNSTDPVTAVVQ